MTWITCASGVAVADGVVVTASLLAGCSSIQLGAVDWLPWVVNVDEVRSLKRLDSLCDLFRAHGVVEEELSSISFTFGLIVGNFPYLPI